MSKKRLITTIGVSFVVLTLFTGALAMGNNVYSTKAQQEFKFEAEDGVITGVNSSVTPELDDFINVCEATGTRPTGGTKAVEYMGHEGNEIRWGFVTNEATTNSGLMFYLCVCDPGIHVAKENLGLYLNGVEVDWNETNLPTFKGNPNWYTWEGIYCDALNFKSGNNTLTLINKSGFNVNFDGGSLYLPDTTTITLNNSVIDNSVIDYKGTGGGTGGGGDNEGTSHIFRYEAETAKIEGTISNSASSFIIEAENTGLIPTSKGKCVSNWATSGNTITWKINSSLATKNSGLSVYIANKTTTIISLANNLTFSVNGVNVVWNDETFMAAPSEDALYTWFEISADNYNLKQGENVLSLNNIGGIDISVDCICVYVSDQTELELLPISEKPTISNYEVKTIDISTNNQVVFSFIVSDDNTILENLTITVKVFLRFGEADQAKITVKPVADGYAFIPTEIGTYTLLIKVEDSDGQTESITKTIQVEKEGSVNSGAGLQTNVKQTVMTTSIILLCVAAVGIAGLVTYIVIKKKKMAFIENNANGGKENE